MVVMHYTLALIQYTLVISVLLIFSSCAFRQDLTTVTIVLTPSTGVRTPLLSMAAGETSSHVYTPVTSCYDYSTLYQLYCITLCRRRAHVDRKRDYSNRELKSETNSRRNRLVHTYQGIFSIEIHGTLGKRQRLRCRPYCRGPGRFRVNFIVGGGWFQNL